MGKGENSRTSHKGNVEGINDACFSSASSFSILVHRFCLYLATGAVRRQSGKREGLRARQKMNGK